MLYLQTHSVVSFTDLINAIQQAYKKQDTKPTSSFMLAVFNWMGFFGPFVKDIADADIKKRRIRAVGLWSLQVFMNAFLAAMAGTMIA